MEQVPPPFPFAGEIAALAAAFVWAISLSMFRRAGSGVPSNVLNLYKSVVALTCMGVAAVVIRRPFPSDPAMWAVLGASGIVGITIGDTGFFAGLRRLGAQMASAIQCLAPPMAAVIAAVFLHETMTANQWTGLVITVAGVTGVVYFRNREESHISKLAAGVVVWGIVFSVIGALGQACGVVISRGPLQNTNVLHGTMMRLLPAVAVLCVTVLVPRGRIDGREIFESKRSAAILTGASVLGSFVGLLLLTTAVKYSKAGVATALSSTFPVWTIPIAYLFLRERATWQGVACTIVAVLGIALMFIGRG